MHTLYEQLFPVKFILGYIQEHNSYQRFLTYTCFRFLSAAHASHPEVLDVLAGKFSITLEESDFSLIEAFLAEDCYFSPDFVSGSFDPLFLAAAIRIVQDLGTTAPQMDLLFKEFCPHAVDIDYTDPLLTVTEIQSIAPTEGHAYPNMPFLAGLILTETDFYGALYHVCVHYKEELPVILPKFAAIYWKELHFSTEDFILYDFMDEYFETEHCREHLSFTELTDTLVAATLTYHKTDLPTLAKGACMQMAAQKSSRFAMLRQFGAVSFPQADTKSIESMLEKLFRYAVLYELRNNLFDFHLEEDNLITLSNWKEKLRWHYVQYSNVYDAAMDAFFSALLSKELLRMHFYQNLLSLSTKG